MHLPKDKAGQESRVKESNSSFGDFLPETFAMGTHSKTEVRHMDDGRFLAYKKKKGDEQSGHRKLKINDSPVCQGMNPQTCIHEMKRYEV